MSVRIGTSGWNYDHWQGPFYPDELAQKEWLSFYCERLPTVEVNNSFYQLPSEKTLEAWKECVPQNFVFSVKASRYITHMKKLKDPEESLDNFLKRVELLEDKLGPILFQLPPNWNFNLERLNSFLQALPQDFNYTFELRDKSWLNSEAYAALSKYNAAFCIYQFKGDLSPKEVTADFVYIRLHGPNPQEYTGKYSRKTLAGWAGALTTWQDQGKDIYCYFDNDGKGHAAQNALELQEMLS